MNVKERKYKIKGLYELYLRLSVWSASHGKSVYYLKKARHCKKELKHLQEKVYEIQNPTKRSSAKTL